MTDSDCANDKCKSAISMCTTVISSSDSELINHWLTQIIIPISKHCPACFASPTRITSAGGDAKGGGGVDEEIVETVVPLNRASD